MALIVLSTGLDLLDLSEPVVQTQSKAKKTENASRDEGLKAAAHRKKTDSSDLIKVDAEQKVLAVRVPEKSSLDLGENRIFQQCYQMFLLTAITKNA